MEMLSAMNWKASTKNQAMCEMCKIPRYGDSWPLCVSAFSVRVMAVPVKEKICCQILYLDYDTVLSEGDQTDKWNQ